jgi:hypothetical protein
MVAGDDRFKLAARDFATHVKVVMNALFVLKKSEAPRGNLSERDIVAYAVSMHRLR